VTAGICIWRMFV